LKQKYVLSPLLFNFALEYVIRRVHVNQNGLKLNGTHPLLVCADDVDLLGRSVRNIKKSTSSLVVASKETALEVHGHVSRSECVTKSQYED